MKKIIFALFTSCITLSAFATEWQTVKRDADIVLEVRVSDSDLAAQNPRSEFKITFLKKLPNNVEYGLNNSPKYLVRYDEFNCVKKTGHVIRATWFNDVEEATFAGSGKWDPVLKGTIWESMYNVSCRASELFKARTAKNQF